MAEATSSSSPDGRRRPQPRRAARQFALGRLSRRSHGEQELRDKMGRAGYSQASIGETVAFLHEYGYLDDARFARDVACSRSRHRHWGPARIRDELEAARVAEEHIEAALRAAFPEGEAAAAKGALGRLLERERRGTRPAGGRARAYRYLLSRGYSPSLVDDLLSERDFGDTDGLESPEFETK